MLNEIDLMAMARTPIPPNITPPEQLATLAAAFQKANPGAYTMLKSGPYKTAQGRDAIIARMFAADHPDVTMFIASDNPVATIDNAWAAANRQPDPIATANPTATISTAKVAKYANTAGLEGRALANAGIQASLDKLHSRPDTEPLQQAVPLESLQPQTPSSKPTSATPDGMMRTHEAYEALGLTPSAFREFVRGGYITPALQKNGNAYFKTADVQRLAASRRH